MEDQIEAKRLEIVDSMKALQRKLEAGNDVELLAWIIPGALACAQRPLRWHPRYGGSGLPIPSEAKPLIMDWVEQIRMEEIASIITFMHDRDLKCYQQIDLGGLNLTAFLEHGGFQVCRLPWEDPHHSKTDPAAKRAKLEHVRKDALEAFDRLPSRVLVHVANSRSAACEWPHSERCRGVFGRLPASSDAMGQFMGAFQGSRMRCTAHRQVKSSRTSP